MNKKQVNLIAQREQAIHLLRAGQSIKEVAEALNRHENWVYKWRKRYKTEGWSGLTGHSQAPKQHGKKLSLEVSQAICQARSELEAEAARGEGLKYIGPIAVKTRLKDKKVKELPSRASIERVLKNNGMTKKEKKNSPENVVKYPHLKPSKPHQLCQVDIVPHFLTGGKRVACFNAIDVISRYPTGQPYGQRRSQDAARFLVHLWQEIGIPHYTQVDNESCFSGGATHKHVLGKVVRLALNIGTELLFSPVYHPKSNGTVERFHQDYNLHVWEGTYLSDRDDVQERSKRFFSLYRHRRDHSKLNDQSPDECHYKQPPTKLSTNFILPTTKLPLREGRIHFLRRVDLKGGIKVLNVVWDIPRPDILKGVWVTIEFKKTGATLSIYDAAPDVTERRCLKTHPFPINEPVLPRPVNRKANPPLSADHTSPSVSDVLPHSPSNLLPPPTQQPTTNTERLLVSLISSASRLVNHIFHTIY